MPHIIRNGNCIEITDEEYIERMENNGYVGIIKKEDGDFYCDGKKVGAFTKEDLMALKLISDEMTERLKCTKIHGRNN